MESGPKVKRSVIQYGNWVPRGFPFDPRMSKEPRILQSSRFSHTAYSSMPEVSALQEITRTETTEPL